MATTQLESSDLRDSTDYDVESIEALAESGLPAADLAQEVLELIN